MGPGYYGRVKPRDNASAKSAGEAKTRAVAPRQEEVNSALEDGEARARLRESVGRGCDVGTARAML